jgi:hypothetical protein
MGEVLAPEGDAVAGRSLRAALVGIAVAVGVGVAATAVVFAIVAIPIHVIGSDDGGVDRDLVRLGLFAIAAPLGSLLGVVAGAVAALWYRRGARLPEAAGR